MKQTAKKLVRRYLFFIIMAAALIAVLIIDMDTGADALDTMLYSLREMALILPPIFMLLGLLDVWVPRETMVRFMGEGSGLKGAVLAIVLGSAAAGPLYAAFPVAGIFMKKGAKYTNVLLFMGAWSTTKIPMLLFEFSSMGPLFALTRLGLSLIGITVIAQVTNKLMGRQEIEKIYENAINM